MTGALQALTAMGVIGSCTDARQAYAATSSWNYDFEQFAECQAST